MPLTKYLVPEQKRLAQLESRARWQLRKKWFVIVDLIAEKAGPQSTVQEFLLLYKQLTLAQAKAQTRLETLMYTYGLVNAVNRHEAFSHISVPGSAVSELRREERNKRLQVKRFIKQEIKLSQEEHAIQDWQPQSAESLKDLLSTLKQENSNEPAS